jgi:hypothetical protein
MTGRLSSRALGLFWGLEESHFRIDTCPVRLVFFDNNARELNSWPCSQERHPAGTLHRTFNRTDPQPMTWWEDGVVMVIE